MPGPQRQIETFTDCQSKISYKPQLFIVLTDEKKQTKIQKENYCHRPMSMRSVKLTQNTHINWKQNSANSQQAQESVARLADVTSCSQWSVSATASREPKQRIQTQCQHRTTCAAATSGTSRGLLATDWDTWCSSVPDPGEMWHLYEILLLQPVPDDGLTVNTKTQ